MLHTMGFFGYFVCDTVAILKKRLTDICMVKSRQVFDIGGDDESCKNQRGGWNIGIRVEFYLIKKIKIKGYSWQEQKNNKKKKTT